MFFYASKLAWIFVQPSHSLALLFLLGLFFIWRKRWNIAITILAAGAGFYIAAGYTPLASALLLPLEQRYNRSPDMERQPLSGIIVLGGGLDPELTIFRNQIVLTDAGERMAEALRLAHMRPEAKIVFTGGDSALDPSGVTEASVARQMFIDMGVSPDRIISEDRSRNTYENAQFTTALLKPKPGERWVLVTSAAHMPRAMGSFRKAGFNVEPWPVNYQTISWADLYRISADPTVGLRQFDIALREWLGLIVYRIAGRTDNLLP